MSHDDYLWDRSGEPDPELERLESLLAPLGHRPSPRRRVPALLLVAAAVLLGWLGWSLQPAETEPGWALLGSGAQLAVGEWLETDAELTLQVADIGVLSVAPDSRLRIKETGVTEHRLELTRGQISAQVIAPPRLLIVETPTAEAVDLGCAYTLSVLPDGGTELVVTSGHVALEAPGREVVVPAGARARSHPGSGPGTPYFLDAAPDFLAALGRYDAQPGAATAGPVLAAATARDTLSLWHLLGPSEPALREQVWQRILVLVPQVADTVPQDEVLAGDPAALGLLLSELGWFWPSAR